MCIGVSYIPTRSPRQIDANSFRTSFNRRHGAFEFLQRKERERERERRQREREREREIFVVACADVLLFFARWAQTKVEALVYTDV